MFGLGHWEIILILITFVTKIPASAIKLLPGSKLSLKLKRIK